ncbi:MAG: flavin reductase family protein [Bacteroidetes bacterium]|nr:flavin reductase family protein [Bacteroidota bacterium]
MRKLLFIFLLGFLVHNSSAINQADSNDDPSLKNFLRIDPKEIAKSPISLFGDNWFVVSCGDSTKFNEMTISWGAMGFGWNVPTITVYIRNTRFTYEFIDKGKYFVLNSFDEKYREKVRFIGSHTGRNTDKVKETGLTPGFTPLGNPYFEEASLVIECEKIYFDDIVRSQLFEQGQKNYSTDPKETHRMFIGKIVNVWQKK